MLRFKKRKHETIPPEIGMPRQLLDAVGNAIILLSPDMAVLYLNERARELLGPRSPEIEKLSDLLNLVVPAEKEYFSSMIERGLSGDNVQLGFTARLEGIDEDLLHVQFVTSALAADGKRALMVTMTDVSDREKAEIRYRTLVERSSDAILIIESSGTILSANAATKNLFGLSPEELEGEDLLNFVSPERTIRAIENMEAEGRSGKRALDWPANFRARVTIGGSDHQLEVATASLGGKTPGNKSIVMINDVTERETALRRLDMSEERYRTIVEETREAIVMVNRAGNIMYANPAAEAMFGTTLAKVKGSGIFDFVALEDRDRAATDINRVFATGKPGGNMNLKILKADGTPLDVEASNGLVGWPGKEAVEIFVIRDVTERIRTEDERVQKLKLEEARTEISRRLIDPDDVDTVVAEVLGIMGTALGINHAIYVEVPTGIGENVKVIEWSEPGVRTGNIELSPKGASEFPWAFELLSGRKELVFDDIEAIEGTTERDAARAMSLKSLIAIPVFEGSSFRRIIGCNMFGEKHIWLPQEVEFIRRVSGTISRALERKNWIEEISKSQQFFENVTENVLEGLMVMHNGVITWVNDRLCEMYGYTKEEMAGKTAEILIRDADYLKNYVMDMVGPLYRNRKYISEEKAIHKNGTVFDVLVSLTLTGDPHQDLVELVVAIKDITQDKQMREEAATTAEAYSTIFSSVGDGLIVHSVDGVIIDANERASLYSGYTRDELLMMNVKDLLTEEYDKIFEKKRNEFVEKGVMVFEAEVKRKNGETLPVEASIKQTMIWGKTVLLSLFRDISERKAAEEEDNKRTLQLASLNEVVKASASSLDLNIVVGVILNVVLDVSGADNGVVILENPPGGRAHSAVAFLGCSNEYIALFNREHLRKTYMDIASSPDGASILSGESVNEWIGLEEPLRKSGSAEMLFIPLKSGEKIVGVVGLGSKQRGVFIAKDADFFNAIGAEIGVSIENALIYQELAAEHERLSLLYRSAQSISGELELDSLLDTTVQKASRAIRAEWGLIGLLEPETKKFVWSSAYNTDLEKVLHQPITYRDGIGGLVYREKRAILVSSDIRLPDGLEKNLENDQIVKALGAREFIVVPLISKDRVVGIMCLVVDGGDRKLSNEDALLLEAMGRQAGVAIENAELYEETRRHLEAIEEAHRELMVLDMMKSDFVSTVSHELRSPLAVIGGFAKTLVEHFDEIDRETEKDSLGIILEKSIALEGLIENILDMSRLEEGRLGVTIKKFDIVELAEVLCLDLGRASEDHRIELSLSSDQVFVMADSDKVEMALGNLLRNAMKFSPDGGMIKVCVARAGAVAEVTVEDEGVGIPENELERIFDRFYQVESHEARSFAGTGLGLYITRELLHGMGGDISVESKLGKGSVFKFSLPLAGQK